MSIDVPSHGRNPDESDPLRELHLGQLDPRLESILDKIKEAQQTIKDDDEDTIEEKCEELNDLLEAMDWIGGSVEVSGKLRMTQWASEESFSEEFLSKYNLQVQEDERGKYVDVDDLKFINSALIAEIHEQGDTGVYDLGAYVLTFFTREELAGADQDKRKKADLVATGGKLIMYPEDVRQMEFATPSPEQIKRFLEAHYPKVYRSITETVGMDIGSNGKRLLRDLKQFTMPSNLEMSFETRGWIGDYLYGYTGIDEEAEYEFALDGEIAGMSVKHGPVVIEEPEHEHLRGNIVALHIEEETSRILFIVAELSPNGGREGRIIPIDSVKNLRNNRRSQQRFGETAMIVLESAEEWAHWWRERRDSGSISENIDLMGEIKSEQKDSLTKNDLTKTSIQATLAAFEEQFMYVRDPEYNVEEGYYEISLTQDIATILSAYIGHRIAFDQITDSQDDDAFNDLLQKALNECDDLKHGDQVLAKGGAILLRSMSRNGDGSIEYDVELVPTEDHLSGKFVAIMEAEFPSPLMIESGGDTRQTERGLGIVLEDTTLTSPNEHYPEDIGKVIVRIPTDQTTQFVKVEYGMRPGHAD